MLRLKRFQSDHKDIEDDHQWTVQDRIEEVKVKIGLRKRDRDATISFLQRKKKESQVLIRHLRKDIKAKRSIQHSVLYVDEEIIREALEEDSESCRALNRSTVDNAIEEKNEHIFDRIRRLNSIAYDRELLYKKLRSLKCKLADMEDAAKPREDKKAEQTIRILSTTIEKMKMKCSSAHYVQKTYKKILFHLENDNLALPGKLRKLELKVNSMKRELESDLVETQKQAKVAYEIAKADKEKLDTRLLKAKKARDKDLFETKRTLRILKEVQSDREYIRQITKKRLLFKQNSEEAVTQPSVVERSKELWHKAKIFVKVRMALDKLQDKTGVNHPSDIVSCLENQQTRTTRLSNTVMELEEKRRSLSHALAQRKVELRTLEEDYFIATDKTRIECHRLESEIEEKRKSNQAFTARLYVMNYLILQVTSSADNIRSKLVSCDEVAKRIRQLLAEDYTLSNTLMQETEQEEEYDEDDYGLKSLLYCGERIHHLDESISSLRRESIVHRLLMHGLEEDRAQNLLVRMQSRMRNNSRVHLTDEEDLFADDFLGRSNEIENTQYVSRSAIKFSMQMMTDHANSRRKAKRQKES